MAEFDLLVATTVAELTTTSRISAAMTGPAFDLTDPASYRFWTTDRVRFSDQDGSGHINNVAYAAYVETGRIAFLQEMAAAGQPEDGTLIIVRLAIDYHRESHYPGEVRIGARIIRVGEKSCIVACGVFKDGACIATAECVMAFLRDGRAVRPTEPTRRRLAQLLTD